MKKTFKFFICQLGAIILILFVIVGCSDDEDDPGPEPKYLLSLEVNPEGAGDVTGAGEYQEEEQVAIEATAAEGYMFVEWTGDVEHVNNVYSANTTITMPARNISLTAVFGEGSLMDVDRNVYQTVIIGNQEWMAENLRVTRYNNEDDIPTSLSDSEWENTTSGAYAIYKNNDDMLQAYGKLYNWYTVDDSRGLCPEGWSVPSDGDWTELVDYIADQGFPNSNVVNGAANALKSCRQVNSPLGGECNTSTHPRWSSHDTHFGLDEFAFSALPGGYRSTDGNYGNIGYGGYWWSSSESSSTDAWFRYMNFSLGNVHRLNYGIKKVGLSVRCFRNIE